MTRLTIICISCVIVSLMFAGQSSAKVDPVTMVGIWLFDEGTGDIAQDSSGNENDGTLNGPKWTNQSKFGSALEFNGAGSYVEFATGQKMKTPHFTITAWFNTRKLNGYGHIFQTGNDWNDMAGYVLRVHQDGTIQAGLAFGPGNLTSFVTGPAVQANTWYHTALTFDGTAATLYLDGENVASNPGQGQIMYDDRPVRIGILSSGTASAFDGFIDEVALFNVALDANSIGALMNDGLAEFAGNQAFASRPDPKDGAMHPDTWVTVSWKSGKFAVSHDVYLGDRFDDVNGATRQSELFRGNQTTNYYIAGFAGVAYPDGLVPGTTYYWRIDEVNTADPNSPWKGPVWRFSIPPKKAYEPTPADRAESIALNVKLTWTAGFGAKLHTVYFDDNRDTVANAAGGVPQGAASYTPRGLKMAKTYYWRVDEFDGAATYKGDVWSFTTVGAAGNPNPADGAAGISTPAVLTWRAGSLAASHEVYFGTGADAVKNATKASPEYKGPKALGDESYDPGELLLETSYYWRIDEVNTVNPDSPWKGNVWTFATGNWLLVDGFESYNDIDPPNPASHRIFDTWIDGYGTTTNGALVGNNLPPYAEPSIVHSGAQSMPLFYDNNLKYSEATMTLTGASRDWTRQGVVNLSLWFRGDAANAAEKMYVALNGSAVVYHDDANAAKIAGWTQWVIPLQQFAGVNLTNVTSISIGLGTKGSTTTVGGTGKMYFDDIRLYR